MQLDGRLGFLEMRPREDRQAKIDGGGVEGVDRVVEFETKILVGIQLPGDLDQ